MADVAVVEKPSTTAVEPPPPAASASNPADADLDDLGCSLWIYGFTYGNLDLRLWLLITLKRPMKTGNVKRYL